MGPQKPKEQPKDPNAITQEENLKGEKSSPEEINNSTNKSPDNLVDNNGDTSAPTGETKPVPKVEEKIVELKYEAFNLKLSNRGLGFTEIIVNDFTDREGKPIPLSNQSRYQSFGTYLEETGELLNFEITRSDDVMVEGQAQVGEVLIKKQIKFEPGLHAFTVNIKIDGFKKGFQGIRTYLADRMEEYTSSFIVPSYEHQEIFFNAEGSQEREIVNTEENYSESFKNVNIAAVSSQYFALSILDNSDVLPTSIAQTNVQERFISAALIHKPIEVGRTFEIKYRGFMGPKEYDLLNKVDERLVNVIDFGFFSMISKPFLRLLKWFHSILGNWGLAIIALTLLVRGIVLPFNVTSYKSMKKMQKLQGPIAELRERYKDNPQQLNQEMMALWKREGVNPVSGCAPMLLQLPVFFALYQVFGKAIELYKAPFFLWINDLSMKDPYYILPILMGITMFIQTKISPSTADPNQKKIFMFMPIVFTLFMVSLPSGLTLYIFVSTLFGIFQQLFFMRDKATAAKEVKA